MDTPNFKYIQELSEGDDAFEKQLISILKKELPQEIMDYKNYSQLSDYKQMAASVHKLKHKISILGLEEGYEIASSFEENLKKKQLDFQKDFEKIKGSEFMTIIGHFTDKGSGMNVIERNGASTPMQAQGWDSFFE